MALAGLIVFLVAAVMLVANTARLIRNDRRADAELLAARLDETSA